MGKLKVNTQRITLITFAIFVSATIHATQLELVPDGGGRPVTIDGNVAAAMSPVFKDLVEDLPAKAPARVSTPFASETLELLVAALQVSQGANASERSICQQMVSKYSSGRFGDSHALALLHATIFYETRRMVHDACLRYAATRSHQQPAKRSTRMCRGASESEDVLPCYPAEYQGMARQKLQWRQLANAMHRQGAPGKFWTCAAHRIREQAINNHMDRLDMLYGEWVATQDRR